VSQAIQWIKSNVVIVICIAVIVLSMLTLLWPTAGAAASLREQVEQLEQMNQQGRSYVSRQVTIPAETPGEPPQSANIAINEAAVGELRRIFADMNDSYGELEDAVVSFNREGPANTNPHVPMVEDLFPRTTLDSKLLGARTAYKRGFVDLYKSLEAGLPPATEQLTMLAEQVTANFAAANPFETNVQSNPELQEQIAKKTLESFVERARNIRVYCPPTQLVGDQLQAGVFAIGEWARRDDRPTMAELWRGQMNYWIQQDLVAAIRVANYDPQSTSVLDLPVKRILSIGVVPGYIGVPPRGDGDSRGFSGTAAATTATAPAPPDDLNQPLPRDFRIAHTGRRSNSLYDVRHATMSVLVDARQLPKLLNAFGQVNLMTPIVQQIVKIDQTEHLRNGYVYGNGVDVVQVDLLIETLWLREWTAGHYNREQAEQFGEPFDPGLMPDAVRYQLSLPTRQEGYVPSTGDGSRGTGRGRPVGASGEYEEYRP